MDPVVRFGAECVSTLLLVMVACRVLSSGHPLAPLVVGVTAAVLVVIVPAAPGLGAAVAAASWLRGMLSTGQFLVTVAGQLSGAGLGALLSRLLLGPISPLDVTLQPSLSVAGWLVVVVASAVLGHAALARRALADVVPRSRPGRPSPAPVVATVGMLAIVTGGLGVSLFNPSLLIGALGMGWLTPAAAIGCVAAQLCGTLAGALPVATLPVRSRGARRPPRLAVALPLPRAAGDAPGTQSVARARVTEPAS